MDDPTQQPLEGDPPEGAPPPASAASVPPPAVSLPPDAIRNSPEYRQLMQQNRTLARQAGDSNAALAAARTEAEASRQAAEAQKMQAQSEQVRSILGDEGVAVWQQFADLSQTDPVAAAKVLADWKVAQSRVPVGAPAAGTPPAGATTMPAQGYGAPPPISSGLLADSPLGSIPPQESDEAVIAALDTKFAEVAKRAQDPLTRNRVTDKERNEGIMAHFAAGVVKGLSARRAGSR